MEISIAKKRSVIPRRFWEFVLGLDHGMFRTRPDFKVCGTDRALAMLASRQDWLWQLGWHSVFLVDLGGLRGVHHEVAVRRNMSEAKVLQLSTAGFENPLSLPCTPELRLDRFDELVCLPGRFWKIKEEPI